MNTVELLARLIQSHAELLRATQELREELEWHDSKPPSDDHMRIVAAAKQLQAECEAKGITAKEAK